MHIRGSELVEKYQNAFLAKADKAICADILDIMLFYKNPHIVLNASNPLLQRYYLRLLIKILKDQKEVEVYVCSGRRHIELHQYFSKVLEGVSMEAASQSARDKLRVVVFLDGLKINKDDKNLIKEIQTGFPALGLGYITIAPAEMAEDLQAKCFTLEQEAQQERINSLVDDTLSAAKRRRLVKILTR
jgi:hypothetical protein